MNSYSQTAAANMLGWYARNMPEELPTLVMKLERRPMTLSAAQAVEDEDTRSWWQRGLDAITNLGSEAVEAVGDYQLQRYRDAEAEKLRVSQWNLELETQRQLADEYAIRAQTMESRRIAEQDRALIEKEVQASKWRPFVIPAMLVAGGLGLWWLWRVTSA